MARKSRPTKQKECKDDIYVEWLDHVKNASKERVVFVMHKKDADVLASFGIKNLFYYTEPEFKLLEQIKDEDKECILLFDASRPANKLCEHLKSELEQMGVKCNTRFRKILFTSQFKELSGLNKFLRIHVDPSARKYKELSF